MGSSANGGAELFFERLCRGLHDAGEAVLPVIRRDETRAARLRAGGLAPTELAFRGALDLVTPLRLRRVLRGRRPEVVVAWMGRAAAAVPRGTWTLVGRLGGYYDLRRFARCGHLVGNTRHLADWMMSHGVPSARVHYLPNFVPDFMGAVPADMRTLGVPEGAAVVLALGRLHAAKGFDLLVRALAAVPEAHVVIAGDGPARDGLVKLAAQLGVSGRLHLAGWREDTAGLLAACDLLVCPSRLEPLGNVVLEGWSAGRPVVAAAAEGPRGLIRGGVDGMLVPVEDAAALAAAIRRLLADPDGAAGMVQAGRVRYLAEFGETSVVGAWRDFLHAVAP